VSREGERRDRNLFNVQRQPSGGLDRVGVQRHAPFGADTGEFFYGLHGPDLVVRPHHGGERRLRTQGVRELRRVHEPVRVHPNPGDLEAL
jgi:hypothetical protein